MNRSTTIHSSIRYLIAAHGLEIGLERGLDEFWAEEEEKLEDRHALKHEKHAQSDLCVDNAIEAMVCVCQCVGRRIRRVGRARLTRDAPLQSRAQSRSGTGAWTRGWRRRRQPRPASRRSRAWVLGWWRRAWVCCGGWDDGRHGMMYVYICIAAFYALMALTTMGPPPPVGGRRASS